MISFKPLNPAPAPWWEFLFEGRIVRGDEFNFLQGNSVSVEIAGDWKEYEKKPSVPGWYQREWNYLDAVPDYWDGKGWLLGLGDFKMAGKHCDVPLRWKESK